MCEPPGSEPERLAARARPPRERDPRVEQRERRLQQRQRGMAGGDHQRRARRRIGRTRAGCSRMPPSVGGAASSATSWAASWPGSAPSRMGRPPTRSKPALVAVAPDSGNATSKSPTGASVTRPPAAPSGASGLAVTVALRCPARTGPRRSCRGRAPGQRHRQRRVGYPGLHRGEVWREMSAIPASCCCEKPLACRARRRRRRCSRRCRSSRAAPRAACCRVTAVVQRRSAPSGRRGRSSAFAVSSYGACPWRPAAASTATPWPPPTSSSPPMSTGSSARCTCPCQDL